ncbi:FAD binding domain-containing protein isoform 2 [Cladophialophora immunda]|nr:FAD binding domain-containing protein isoform 1 [Cladophialophora immunda]OQV00656.1 FAD binding domain-containing protein isoform 2 [Cladophialophora immunda]
MTDSHGWISELQALVDGDELALPGSQTYIDESKTWATQKHLNPKVLVRPQSAERLSRVLAYLNDSELDFAVRSGGVGSSSAKDVVISLAAFDRFEFDPNTETITIGAGQTWGDVDRKLEREGPGYAALSARCTFVGVGGGTVAGGISWASSEFGLTSDPQNLLDAQVITVDGRVLWASTEPELLWALRGGGGGFAVVVALKLRVHKYTSSVYSGNILVPNESLAELAKGVSDFTRRTQDPKVAMHLFCLDLAHAALTGQDPAPGIMIVVYDANGEAHGRSDEGFGWALRIQGAVDKTRAMTFAEANQQQDNLKVAMGMTNSWMSGATLPDLDEEVIWRSWRWFNELLAKDPRQSAGAFVLIEIMQPPAFSSTSARTDTAWPHTNNRHILQLGTGSFPGSPESDALSLKALSEAPFEISPTHSRADYTPNFIDSFNDVEAIFGENHPRLKEIKKKYDPKGRLGGHFA